MKTHRAAIMALAMMALVSCGKKSEKTAGGEIPPVEVAYPEVDSVTLHRTFPGFLHASQSAEVVGRVSGTLLTKNFQAGQYVTQGQVLYTIESTKYRDAVQQAQAALTTALSQRDFYQKQHTAMVKAYAAEAVSQMEVSQSESNLKNAEASIRNAQAALETAQTNLGYCVVRAPISGHITDSQIDVGNFINGEAQPQTLATIYSDGEMNAVFNIEDSQYQLLVGDNGGTGSTLYRSIPLNFNEQVSQTYTADLYYSSPAVDKSTGTLELKGKVQNPKGELKDGMYVSISLPYGTEPHAILVKDASIGTDQLGSYLYVVNDSNKVVYTPIETGEIYRDSLRIVNKGITPKTRYVTKALLTVRSGEEVKPVVAGEGQGRQTKAK